MGIVKKLQQGLLLVPIRLYANRVAITARKKAPTSRIRSNISVSAPRKESNGNILLSIMVKAPEARAYEYGSGEHATIGKKGKYPIVPRPENKTGLLAFRWDNVPEGIRKSKDGRVVATKVMHPGVEPSPYLAPAIEENQTALSKRISDRFADQFFKEVKIAFDTT